MHEQIDIEIATFNLRKKNFEIRMATVTYVEEVRIDAFANI